MECGLAEQSKGDYIILIMYDSNINHGLCRMDWIVSWPSSVQVRFAVLDEVLPSPFDTDVTAEGNDNFVAHH